MPEARGLPTGSRRWRPRRSLLADSGERLILRELLCQTLRTLELGLADLGEHGRVGQDLKSLFERLEILDTQHDGSRTTMLGDHDAAVLALYTLNHFGQPVLHVRQRRVLRHRHSQKYSYYRLLRLVATRAGTLGQRSSGTALG